ncbi:MAG: hypothetical protein R2748_03415 [Bryobacterales bacterium]
MAIVKSMCSRALWLEHGRLKLDAAVDEVMAVYQPPGAVAPPTE